jgi:hypothetical protein
MTLEPIASQSSFYYVQWQVLSKSIQSDRLLCLGTTSPWGGVILINPGSVRLRQDLWVDLVPSLT